MTYSPVYNSVVGLLQLIVPSYALRLNRLFGTRRVGWPVFVTFILLALLHLVRAFQPAGWGFNPEMTIEGLYILIPILLVIGMAHIESLFKERLRVEQEEKRLMADLERQIKQRTADLAKANADLSQEMVLREQNQEALKKSEEQYRLMFVECPEPMWIYDLRSLAFLAVNKAAMRHYGYSEEEFLAMSAKDICLPGQMAAFAAESAKPLAGVQSRGLWRHCKKDRSLVEVEITALDLMYKEQPARLMMAEDLTENRQHLRESLQTQKVELTTRLAGGAGQRFNGLVSVMEGYADMLLQRGQHPETTELLMRIVANAESASCFARQLLAIARQHPQHMEWVNLNELVENQIRVMSQLVGQTVVERHLASKLPDIQADPGLVGQILHHLALNALESMSGTGVLTIGTAPISIDASSQRRHPDARPGEFVCLTVSDTGCGMTPEVQAHLFEPFFTTKQREQGKPAAGLGLATALGFVQQHSGWIEVTSQPGAGTRARVFFPLVKL